MKKIFFITAACIILANSSYAQRYLENVFTAADSITNISYGSAIDYLHNTQDLLVDFYEPHNDHFKKRPLIIYVHGGGFRGGGGAAFRAPPSVLRGHAPRAGAVA